MGGTAKREGVIWASVLCPIIYIFAPLTAAGETGGRAPVSSVLITGLTVSPVAALEDISLRSR